MSQVVSEFSTAVRTAVDAPVHALLVFVAALVGMVLGAVLGFIPFVGPLVNGIVVGPLTAVAVVGSANAVRNGDGAFDGATAAVKRVGPDVMGAYAILTVAYVGVSIVLTLLFGGLMFAAGMGGGMPTGGGPSAMMGAVGVVGVLVGLVAVVVLLLVGMAVQFVAPAAVVAGTGAVASLKTSFRFLKRHLLGVTGFSLVLVGVGVVGVLVAALLYAVGQTADPRVGIVLGLVGYLAAVAVGGAISSLYLVGYFESTVEPADLPEDHSWPDDPDDESSDAGDFVVGDVSTVEESGSADDEAETSGFDVEMAGEGTDDEE